MSDIPPELLEESKRVVVEYGALEKAERFLLRFWRGIAWFGLAVFLVAVSVLFGTAQAATFDTNSVFCETFAQDPDNGRYYIASDPQWTPQCTAWVTLQASKFQMLVDAYEGGAGSGSTASQFTPDEVASLKWQAANPSPFNLSFADGALVGSSVLAVWALAAVFKTLVLQLQDHFSPSE